jgi:hypothetical protein
MIIGTPAMTNTLPICTPGAVETVLRAHRDQRHTLARLVELARLVARRHRGHGLRVIVDADAERGRHRFESDVVMRRPDAAGGENIGVAGPERVQRRDDFRLDVGHDAGFAQIDAQGAQELRDIASIGILGAAGQDLVPDDEDGGGDTFGLAHWGGPV